MYVALNNAYATLPEFAAPPDPTTTTPRRNAASNDAVAKHGSKHRRKIERRRKAKIASQLKKVSENDFFDDAMPMAEDEGTVMAKSHNRSAIDSSGHKTAPSIIQHGRNASGSVIFALKRAVRNLTSVTKRVRFQRETKTATFRSEDEAIIVTYDSGADSNYISETNRAKAGPPILCTSTKRVGVANGGKSTGKYRTRLPIPNLSLAAAEADSFQDFPMSLLSVGKVEDDGNVSIFDKDGVKVYAKEDVLIMCKGKPIMIGKRDERGRYQIPLMQ